MKNFKNYNLFNVLIFNLFFCFYAFSQDINNPDQYAKDVNERIEKSSRKELRLISKNLLDFYLKTSEDLNLEIDINAELNSKINLLNANIGRLNVRKDELNNKVLEMNDSIQNLRRFLIRRNQAIESQARIIDRSTILIKDKDSIIKELISQRDSLTQEAVLNIDSGKTNDKDDFLNKMLIKKVKIDNQSFKLIPNGIITATRMSYSFGDEYYDYDTVYIDQFIPLSDLNIGVISQQTIEFELSRSFTSPYQFVKTAFWDPIKKMNYSNFLSRYNNYFPTFNFTQGRLLNIKTRGGESDYLSIILNNPESKNYNADGFNFELVDNSQEKLIIPTIFIDNELYIYLDVKSFEKLNYTFRSSALQANVKESTRYPRFSANYEYENADKLLSAHKNSNNISIISISKYKKDNYEEYDKNTLGLYFFTKNSSVRRSRNVIPKGFLFKLEEIN